MRKNLYKILKISRWFVLAQLLDLFTTVFAIVFLGASEANPLMNIYTLPEIAFIKFLAIILVINILVDMENINSKYVIALVVFSALAPIYNSIIIINYTLIGG